MGLHLYKLIVGGMEKHVEVVCQRHYDEMSQVGGFMGPLSETEKRRKNEQVVTLYSGDRECATCIEERERQQKGDAA